MDLGLEGKTALITAASKGIGFGLADALASEGCRVIITSSNQTHLDTALAQLSGRHGSRITSHILDVRFPKLIGDQVGSILSVEKIDILIVNAPGPSPVEVRDLDHEVLQPSLETILLSAVELCHIFLPKMIESGFGRIIFMASSTAKEPDNGMALSNVSRAGLIAYAKTLSREVAQYGITVNSILTGSVLTERTNQLLEFEARQAGVPLDAFLKEAAQAIPAGYICSPAEFALPVAFLCSTAASYVNGVSLPIDGGYMKSV
jgi:3-oxoacyl-[acyl-carrier protein] reductase